LIGLIERREDDDAATFLTVTFSGGVTVRRRHTYNNNNNNNNNDNDNNDNDDNDDYNDNDDNNDDNDNDNNNNNNNNTNNTLTWEHDYKPSPSVGAKVVQTSDAYTAKMTMPITRK